jgi:5'-methylthioadenosine phosphorylase
MRIGIIGGSGLYDLEGLRYIDRRTVTTPFGPPSDSFLVGRLGEIEVCFLPRHGKGHRLLPSEINHRANIFALKTLGVERVLSVSAVGSLKEELRPRDIVLPDQYFDRTKGSREHTFFGSGLVAHVSFGDPTCPELRGLIAAAARKAVRARAAGAGDLKIVEGGTYVSMEGPAFSTKAESRVYRQMGFDVIGMTSLPEAKLCREAELCYQAMAMITDYDCWHETEGPVTVEMIIANLIANTRLAKDIVREAALAMPPGRGCACGHALRSAIITDRQTVPEAVKRDLAPIVGKYL